MAPAPRREDTARARGGAWPAFSRQLPDSRQSLAPRPSLGDPSAGRPGCARREGGCRFPGWKRPESPSLPGDTLCPPAAKGRRGAPRPGAPAPRRSRPPVPPADNRGPAAPPALSPPAQRGLDLGSAAALQAPAASRRRRGAVKDGSAARGLSAGGLSPSRRRRLGGIRAQPVIPFCQLGLVEICLMHPLDVVKTRFQIQRGKTDPTSYKSLGDCFRTIFQREGLLGFYKGIFPPVLAETPKRAVKFFTFEQYKKLLGYASLPPGLAFAVAGLGSGLTEAVVVNPFEVVKVTLQANQNAFKEQPSSFVQARQIIKTDGLGFQGLNKGLTATLGRHGAFNMVYFGFYFNMKNILPVNKDPNLEFLRKFGIGLVSGTIASIINIPFDVAKSRIQGPQPVPGEIKYRTCFKTMATVYKEEGFLALYKGLLPKIMRLGPGGAVMLLIYEYVYAWLQDTVNHK
ncbi:mitochondrial 2-oxodicarboxylate carrier isoform X2 [Manacus candei]|nr:mitochondrial 2-oxodicarboxylate carrier isoform X2 [Manacus candei]